MYGGIERLPGNGEGLEPVHRTCSLKVLPVAEKDL